MVEQRIQQHFIDSADLKYQAALPASCARLLDDISREYRHFRLQLDHVLRCQQLAATSERTVARRY